MSETNLATLDGLDFVRYFIISSTLYVEELEGALKERNDEFWDAREKAYRIVTNMLIKEWDKNVATEKVQEATQ